MGLECEYPKETQQITLLKEAEDIETLYTCQVLARLPRGNPRSYFRKVVQRQPPPLDPVRFLRFLRRQNSPRRPASRGTGFSWKLQFSVGFHLKKYFNESSDSI